MKKVFVESLFLFIAATNCEPFVTKFESNKKNLSIITGFRELWPVVSRLLGKLKV